MRGDNYRKLDQLLRIVAELDPQFAYLIELVGLGAAVFLSIWRSHRCVSAGPGLIPGLRGSVQSQSELFRPEVLHLLCLKNQRCLTPSQFSNIAVVSSKAKLSDLWSECAIRRGILVAMFSPKGDAHENNGSRLQRA